MKFATTETRQQSRINVPMAKRVLTAMLLTAGAVLCAGQASAAILYAGKCAKGGFTTIQMAVNAAAAGDTVNVCPGTYAESVVIEKNLSLVGVASPNGGGTSTYPTIIYPSSVDQECLDGKFCPQIFVKDSTATHVARLTVNGSNFKLSACAHYPVGILFLDSGGTVANVTSENHSAFCNAEGGYDQGDGIDVSYSQSGTFSVDISQNLVSNFADNGIEVDGAYFTGPVSIESVTLSGAITGNKVTTPVNTPSDSPDGISLFHTGTFTISSNTVSIPALIHGLPPGNTGIDAGWIQQLSMGQNSVTNFSNGIETFALESSDLDLNNVSNSYYGIQLNCGSDNTVALNAVRGQLPAPQPGVFGSFAGIYLSDFCGGQPDQGADNNNIVLNAIDGFCGGIVNQDSADTGNSFQLNAFSNVSVDIVPIPGPPCY